MITEEVRNFSAAAAALEDLDGSFIAGGAVQAGQLFLLIEPSRIVEVCRYLKETRKMRLSAVTALDWYPLEPRFEVVYLLHSIEKNERLRLKCKVSETDAAIDSVTSVWKGANWYEREVFDLFGIVFRNHPDLKRIMMPEGWDGHPLRKDFPTTGQKYMYSDEGNVLT